MRLLALHVLDSYAEFVTADQCVSAALMSMRILRGATLLDGHAHHHVGGDPGREAIEQARHATPYPRDFGPVEQAAASRNKERKINSESIDRVHGD